jgi:hypothetical protein
MKLSQEENEKTNNILRKIKNNINKNDIPPTRLYSSFKQRPITSTKQKKQWNINKLQNSEKSAFDFPYLGYTFHTSKYFSNKLYLNKKSFIWGKNKIKKPQKYYEKEELFDRVIKLQNTVNKLNNKNNKQQIEINKQKKELKKQNKILNEVNFKFFFDKLLKNDEEGNRSLEPRQVSTGGEKKGGLGVSLSKRRSYSTEELCERNHNNNLSNKAINNITYDDLKELYKKILKQNDIKEQEILRLKQKIESIKFSNETLISNMKLKYKELQNQNSKKSQEYEELKKSSKCTKYNEVMKEKEVYEKEMLKIKNKFYKALKLLEKYKNCYQENKILIEELNKKKSKIKKLENEIVLFSKNSENLIENMRKDINKKNRKIQKLENELKKYAVLYNNIKKEEDKRINIYDKNGYKLYFQNQNQNNYNNVNYNPNEDINNIENNEEVININNYHIKENEIIIPNNNDIQNENEFIDQDIYKIDKEKDKDKKIYVNHCLNFSDKNIINNNNNNKIIGSQTQSSHSSRANLFSASLKSINKRKEKINNIENNNIINNSRIIEIINLYPELFQLYIEMKKRNINDNKIFINEVLQQLKEENNLTDNKKIYYESIIKLFNIEDNSSKKIIEDLSNKEFVENKSLQEVKIHHIKLFNELFNYKRENNKETLNKKLSEINQDEFNNIINKYDNCESGYIFFNQMISVIKEIKLEDYTEEILLLTKEPDIFDLMNYNNIFNIIKNENNNNTDDKDNNDIPKDQKEEKKENSENKIVEKEKTDIEEKHKNGEIEKIFKNSAHIILIEGSTPSVYISSLKENVKIGQDNEEIEIIIPEKFFNFLENKKISVSEEEKEEIIKEYGIKVEDKYLYIDYDKIVEKIFEYMKNDEGNSNDEDFMKNIKSMDIEGFD